MTTERILRRGSSAECNAFTGADGELVADVEVNQLILHDNIKLGGFRVVQTNLDAVFDDDVKVVLEASGTATTTLIEINNSLGPRAILTVASASCSLIAASAGINVSLGVNSFTLNLDDGNAALRPNADNTIKLGRTAQRWSEVFAGNGTINTSDETEKDLDVLAVEEYNKVLDAVESTLIVSFQFKDSVASKGVDNARVHFGIGAQTLKANFEAQGLDPFKYGVLCWDEWEEELEDVFGDDGQGNQVKVGTQVVLAAGSRYGIRYDQLETLKIACLDRRLNLLEAV